MAAATLNQALNAMVFLYKQVLGVELDAFSAVRSRATRRLPTVLSRREIRALFDRIAPPMRLIAEVVYGGGLRVGEAFGVRVMDVDVDRLQLTVRRDKPDKDRVTPLAERLVEPLAALIDARRDLHAKDLAAGEGWVERPFAFDRKSPRAPRRLNGSTCSPRPTSATTRSPVDGVTDTSTSPQSKGRSPPLRGRRASPGVSRATR